MSSNVPTGSRAQASRSTSPQTWVDRGDLWPDRSKIQEIAPGLYITNFFGAKKIEMLRAEKITHVVVCAAELPEPFSKDFQCLKLENFTDNTGTDLLQQLDVALPWIRSAVDGGGRVLLHCATGSSRSGSVAVAYLMRYRGLSMSDALERARRVRPMIQPNPGFLEQLSTFWKDRDRDDAFQSTSSTGPSSNAVLTLSRPSTPELAQTIEHRDSLKAEPASYLELCAEQDRMKAKWAQALSTAGNKEALAKRLALLVERLHGKAGQTTRAEAIAGKLLESPTIQQMLTEATGFQDVARTEAEAILKGLALVNLGEVLAPSKLYLKEGRPTDEMRENFAGRGQRAAELMAQYGLADGLVQAYVRASCDKSALNRPLPAQMIDLCERLAAMTAQRPQRPAMPPDRIISILRSEADHQIFSKPLIEAAIGLRIVSALQPEVAAAPRQDA